MPLRPFFSVPKSLREWSEWCRNTTVEPGDSTVTEAMLTDNAVSNRVLRDSAAYSVIGNPTASSANPADIAAGADGTFLGRQSGALQFVALQDSDIPATIARDTEVTAAVAAHAAAVDPHPVYLTQAKADALYQTQTQADARYVALSNVLNGSATYDPPSLADGVGATTTVTVTGAVLGDYAIASFSLDLQGISVTAYVSSANTVSVRFQNESTGTLDLASGTLRARVWKQ